jgi:hypothetical protein
MDSSVTSIDEHLLGTAIVSAVTSLAQEIAKQRKNGDEFELGTARKPRIKGYATPKPSVVAVYFSISFDLTRIQVRDGEERRGDGTLSVGGACSYDPNSGEVTEVEIKEWSKTLGGNGEGFSSSSSHRPGADFYDQYTKENIRIL